MSKSPGPTSLNDVPLKAHYRQKNDLARAMGISRTTLNELFKKPNAPVQHPDKGWNLKEMLTFCKLALASSPRRTTGDLADLDIIELRRRELRAKIERQEFLLGKEMDEYILKSVWRDKLAALIGEVQATFRKRLEHELPSELEGLKAIEIRDRLSKAYGLILKDFHARAQDT